MWIVPIIGLASITGAHGLGRYARAITAEELSKNATYDFVIAGGGIAGLTVADRLTEDPNGTFSLHFRDSKAERAH